MWIVGKTLCGRMSPMSDVFALNENDGIAWLLRASETGDPCASGWGETPPLICY